MEQYHIGQEINRLNIHWDILTICQHNCSYCYARKDYGEEGGWGNIPSITELVKIAAVIQASTLPYNLGLLGGEPTVHPHYYKLLNYLGDNLKDSDMLYVVTNGVGDFSDHPILPNLGILWSYHPEYVNEEEFLHNVNIMKDKGVRYKINIMLHPGRKYWAQIKAFIYTCRELDMRIHPHFMYSNVYTLFKYSKDFWDYFAFLEEITEKDLHLKGDLYNDYTLFKNKLNVFTGWDCYNNNYEINVDGTVNQFCKNNIGTKLIDNPNFFKNISETTPIQCKFSSCNCDGLLKQYKVYDKG